MRHRWLTLLVILFIAVVVFLLYYFRLQPVWRPETSEEETATTTASSTLTAPSVSFVNPKRGAAEPTVTVVVFGDFQCAACRTMAENLIVLTNTLPEVQVVWKNLPNESTHTLAVPAAMAAMCAGRQGKFWEFHDLLFDDQVTLSETSFSQFAGELNLDIEKFQTCYDNRETLPLIRQDYEEGLALSISTTPAVFIGEDRVIGVMTAEELIAWAKSKLPTE
jgi:protein-disulfide isomerase